MEPSWILCSMDSLVIAGGASLLGYPEAQKRRLIFGLAAGDMMASAIAAQLHPQIPVWAVLMVFLAACLTLLSARTRPVWFGLVPLFLSMDNLAAPFTSPVSVMLAGACSGLFAWMGFSVQSLWIWREVRLQSGR